MKQNKKYIVAICGASGSIYGIRLIKALVEKSCHVTAIISDAGFQVLCHETNFQYGSSFTDFLKELGVNFPKDSFFEIFKQNDFSASPASGSSVHSGMVIAPCSMKTLGNIAAGIGGNLITRAADVALKERRPLILLPRETPLNMIHLENMTRASRAGAVIMPPCPSFYSYPTTMDELADTVIARVLDHLKIEHDLIPRWGANAILGS
ncbi:MAG: UbiX family flavin prenyltransferase [Thermodesulfobacteriota bacterium]|nr:UbiX family flavin prenyltransferase [Thermodesulfobacteriota bacterium]